jgi:hypothetical protein
MKSASGGQLQSEGHRPGDYDNLKKKTPHAAQLKSEKKNV